MGLDVRMEATLLRATTLNAYLHSWSPELPFHFEAEGVEGDGDDILASWD